MYYILRENLYLNFQIYDLQFTRYPRLRKIFFDVPIYEAKNTFKGIGKHHHEVKNIDIKSIRKIY